MANVYYEIKPQNSFFHINLKEIWRYKELLYIFSWRDIKLRYKQTVLGITWAIFQPFITMVIFSFFFGKLAKIPSDGIPYPVFVYSGLLFWNYFSTSLTNSSNCLISEEKIIQKVYFPRLILPISATITPIVDFFFSSIVLFGLMAYFGTKVNWISLGILPLLILITMISSSGLGLFASSINAKYRDVRYIIPFFIQTLLYITPVIYPVNIIPAGFKWISYVNPMSGVITTARSVLVGNGNVDITTLLISLSASLIFFLFGLFYFKKTERFFSDIL